MRATILAVLMLAIQATDVSAQAATSPSELRDQALAAALHQIAVSSDTRIGFESVEFVKSPRSRMDDLPAVPIASVDEALDAVIAAHPGYGWRRVGESIVVRPTEAWTDVHDPLNRPVHNFKVENTNESEVLTGLRALILTGRFVGQPGSGTPVAFAVQSGTLVDVLNELTQSAGLVLWQATYRPQQHPELHARWDLQLMLVAEFGIRAGAWGSHKSKYTTGW
jgi:hypothetical protein